MEEGCLFTEVTEGSTSISESSRRIIGGMKWTNEGQVERVEPSGGIPSAQSEEN